MCFHYEEMFGQTVELPTCVSRPVLVLSSCTHFWDGVDDEMSLSGNHRCLPGCNFVRKVLEGKERRGDHIFLSILVRPFLGSKISRFASEKTLFQLLLFQVLPSVLPEGLLYPRYPYTDCIKETIYLKRRLESKERSFAKV